MDKYEKKILKFFLNEGRGQSIESYTLQKKIGIPLNKFGDVVGSCVDRKYLWYSPNAKGAKYDQYGLSEIGFRAIDDETKNLKQNRYTKISIFISMAVLIVTIMHYFNK